MSGRIRVAIADGQPIFREGLRRLMEEAGDFEVVGLAGHASEAVALVRLRRPDVLLLDLGLPPSGGLEALRENGESDGEARVLLVAQGDEARLVDSLQLGGRGAVARDATPEMLFKAVRAVVAGQYWVGHDAVKDIVRHLREHSAARAHPAPAERLTRREREIVARVAVGESNREVARQLSLAEDTVKHHLTNVFDKLGVSNRAELAAYAASHGLLEGHDSRSRRERA